MKIGISMRGLKTGSFAIEELIQQLSKELILLGNQHEFFLYFNQANTLSQFKKISNQYTIRYKEIKNRFLFDQLYLPWAFKKDGVDHALYYKNTISLLNSMDSSFLTHDLGYFHPNMEAYKYFETLYMKPVFKLSAKKAKNIFSVSQYTKNEIVKLLGTNQSKIIVCYEGVSGIFKSPVDKNRLALVKEKYNLPDKYIFFPTSLSPRKNLFRTLEAFNLISSKIPHTLYLTGGLSWNSKAIEILIDQSGGKVKKLGTIPSVDMPSLYKLADFTVYPSLLEGFGVPILEAFNTECPILTSNITSMPEIAGDGAYLVDPYSTESISEGMFKLATDDKLKASLINKGRLQAKKFSYKKTAKLILKTIEDNSGEK